MYKIYGDVRCGVRAFCNIRLFGKCIAHFTGATGSKRNLKKELLFFSFPGCNNSETRSKRKIWIEFCKQKAFKASANTKMSPLHFTPKTQTTLHTRQNVLNQSGAKKHGRKISKKV